MDMEQQRATKTPRPKRRTGLAGVARVAAVAAGIGASSSALASGPSALTAALAAITTIGVVLHVHEIVPSLGRADAPKLRDLSKVVLDADDLDGVAHAFEGTISEWDDVDFSWMYLGQLHELAPHSSSARRAKEQPRVFAKLRDADGPTVVDLERGAAVAVPCGPWSRLWLVVAMWNRPSEAVIDRIDDLGALAEIAARNLDADKELSSKRSSNRFEELVRFSSDAIFIVQVDGRIRYSAPSITGVLGYLSVDVEGKQIAGMVSSEHESALLTFLDNVARQDPRNVSHVELPMTRADGAVIQVEITGANLLSNRDVRGIVITVRDVTARHRLQEELTHQAFHDSLTGLANRALFNDRIDRSMAVRRGHDDHAPAVAFLDLDDFKRVNDHYGHAAGDKLLVTVAERIKTCLRKSDTAARLGGDEFALLFEELPGDDGPSITELVQRVVDTIAEPMTFGDDIIEVRVSAGIATRISPEMTSVDLLRHADMAMYRAKLRGKAQVAIYEAEMAKAADDRLSLTAELDHSIRAREMVVHFQPVVDLASGRIRAIEALVRWPHPVKGLLLPAEFIDLAEETGLIVPLGVQVLQDATDALRKWHDAGFADLQVSVNVSARQLQDERFVEEVRTVLTAAGIEPHQLILELTESVLTGDESIVLSRLATLESLGVQIAVDDFGTGNASLTYLQRLPVHHLKIDRAFVHPLRNDEETALAGSIIDLARSLGAVAVAEGIEDERELSQLRNLGCELGQGNLFGPPADAASVLTMLIAGRSRRSQERVDR